LLRPCTFKGLVVFGEHSGVSPTFTSYQRELLLLGGHDPFLDQRDRIILQTDKSLHNQIWKTVINPGAILYLGEIIGILTSKKKSSGIEIKMTLWNKPHETKKLYNLAEEYAAFRQETLENIEM
jgi:hypothetical protein